MSLSKRYAEVILPFSLQGLYTYRIPDTMIADVEPGRRVVVQFGKKKIYTALVKTVFTGEPPDYPVKDIMSVLDNQPVLSNRQYDFWEWISRYYMCTLGEVMKAALPSGMKLESETCIRLNPEVDDLPELNTTEESILELVQNNHRITINDIKNRCGKESHKSLARLIDYKIVVAGEELEKQAAPRQIAMVTMADHFLENEPAVNELFKTLARREKQLHILMTWLSLSKAFSGFPLQPVSKKELLQKSGASDSILKTLVKNNIFVIYQKPVPLAVEETVKTEMKELEPQQNEAINKIKQSFEKHRVVLLHGVTSSGKTEIYIRLIRETIESGKQVLYLLPEIALTTQIIQRLSGIFGSQMGVYHSRHADIQKLGVWKRVLDVESENTCPLVLGVRSAIFLPFSDLGLVIIDEEHENTFKQADPAPRYHARDAAIYLATIHNASVLLGTATPSFETYRNAITGKYGLVELKERYGNMLMPQMLISDLRRKNAKNKPKNIFSTELTAHIENALSQQEQIILFQNRRGFAPYLECADCGWVPECKNCDVSLTYHRKLNQLTCHYCGYTETTWSQCQKCGGTHVETRGLGTEQIEDEVQNRWPLARTARLDLDSTRGKYSYQQIIDNFAHRNLDILVGTQMVTKGLDFDHVSVVGIMNADTLMRFPDFRAMEKSFQLMAQVGGRAGRKNKQGTVIIQTSQPDHPFFELVKENDFKKFYYIEVAEREKFGYPPFTRLIRISIKHTDYRKTDHFAKQMAEKLHSRLGKMVLGPESPPVSRINNKYIKNILLKIDKNLAIDKIRSLLIQDTHELMQDKYFQSVQVVFDVDPM